MVSGTEKDRLRVSNMRLVDRHFLKLSMKEVKRFQSTLFTRIKYYGREPLKPYLDMLEKCLLCLHVFFKWKV
jgi:hypothetical protein